MEAVVLSQRLLHRVSIPILCFCLVLLGSPKESQAQITFVQEPKDTTVVAGNAVSLNCTATGSNNIKYNWLFNGNKIASNSRVIVQKNGTLHITKVGTQNSGGYVCVALIRRSVSQKRVKIKSQKAELTVQSICKASKITLNPDNQLHATGNNLELTCRCSAVPTTATVWIKDGKQVTSNSRLTLASNTLNIGNLEVADSGIYECTATNVLGSKKSPGVNVQVINAIEPTIDEKPQDMFVILGQSVTLKCRASGKPKPKIKWFFGTQSDALVTSSKHTFTSDGSLVISKIEDFDFGDYKCQAKNFLNSLTATAKISKAYIRGFSFRPLVRYAEVGEELTITCKPVGRPKPTVTWKTTKGGAIPASYNIKNETLKNMRVKISDSENFSCFAKNIAGTKSSNVEIIASVFPTFKAEPKDLLANENSKVKLDCSVISSPLSVVTWTKNNQKVIQDSNHKINSNNALVFKRIRTNDKGLYRCHVKYPGKYIQSRAANVTVLASVKLAEYNVINHHKFNKGSTAKIYCSFTGSGPIVVKWKKVGVKNIDKNMESSGGMLIIKNIHINDGGTYLCTGSNLFSNSTVRVNISVFVYPKFDLKPNNTTAVAFESIWLHCNATGDPKPKISWGREQDGGDRLDQERFHQFANGTLRIENIIPQDQGRYYCYAGNPGSFTQITISVRVVTPPGITNASKASAMGRTIAIAVGCAAAYIVLVVGLMIYCKRRRAKQQKKEQLVIPIDGDGENLEANAEMALQPINGKVTNYNKMEFPRHDLEALRTLGNGSYGRAFLARASGIKDGERETMVVVKSLMSKDDIQKEDFLRELNSLINMDNPHVVALLGVCRDMDPLYMIFESLEKGDLKQYLLSCYENGRSTLTSSQKLSLCSNIVSGMTYLASNNFVHKDVAARNCMVTKDLQVKIGFLNLSYDLYNSEYYRFNNILIPLRWMAPEAIFNDDFTEKSDVWSFGVLVWEIYTLGQTPFEERSDEEVLKCIKDDLRLSKPDNCPDTMATIMNTCWEGSPEARPTFDKLYAEISEIAVDTHL